MSKIQCKCGGTWIPIIYGFPGDSLFEKAERGEVALGGCIIKRGAPTERCDSCRRTRGKLRF